MFGQIQSKVKRRLQELSMGFGRKLFHFYTARNIMNSKFIWFSNYMKKVNPKENIEVIEFQFRGVAYEE